MVEYDGLKFHKLVKLNVPAGLTKLSVVGNSFRTDRAQMIWRQVSSGTLVAMRVEPSNVHDNCAVKVYVQDDTALLHAGYVSRDLAADLTYYLKKIDEYSTKSYVVGKLISGKAISILGVIDSRDMFNFIKLYRKG